MIRYRACVLGVLFVIGVSVRAHAELGGNVSSIAADSAALGGTRNVVRAANWDVHVLRAPTGAVVHEYVRGGKVFAVAWSGSAMPDLRRLLGSYFEAYVRDPQGQGTGHHHMRVVATPGWVVQSGGHQGAFVGRAWLTPQLPAGFNLDTLRAW